MLKQCWTSRKVQKTDAKKKTKSTSRLSKHSDRSSIDIDAKHRSRREERGHAVDRTSEQNQNEGDAVERKTQADGKPKV